MHLISQVCLICREPKDFLVTQGVAIVKTYVLAVVVLAALACSRAQAQADRFLFPQVQTGLTETSFLTGYGYNYHIPACMKTYFGFDMATLRFARFTSPTTQVGLELFGGATTQANLEGAAIGSFRKDFPCLTTTPSAMTWVWA